MNLGALDREMPVNIPFAVRKLLNREYRQRKERCRTGELSSTFQMQRTLHGGLA